MNALHPDFLRLPVAHRGLHAPGRPENTMAAFRAAIEAGYGIELDLQPASDGTPLTVHDEELYRLGGQPVAVNTLSPAEAAQVMILGSDQGIPTLRALLDEVAGRVPLLIEIKDQDGALGPQMGDLPARVADELRSYDGPVAVMSFTPHAVADFRKAGGTAPIGLTSCEFPEKDWPDVPAARRAELARLADFDRVGASFISHYHLDLDNPAVTALRERGVPVLCWTIRSPEQESAARKRSDNITFEGFTPCAS